MPKVILEGYILVPDNDLMIVLAELPTHIEVTRQEPGCLLFKVQQDPTNKNKFSVYEEFTNQLAFENHQQRVKESRWGQITKTMQRSYTIT